MPQQKNYTPPQEEEIDIREALDYYIKRWPWFVAGLVLALAVAFIYLKVATPTYQTVATVLVETEDNNLSSEVAAFSELSLFQGLGGSSVYNEIGIFRSKRLMESVVKDLNLNIRYFKDEGLRDVELYGNTPINVQILNFEEKNYKRLKADDKIHPYLFQMKTDSTFVIESEDEGWRKEMRYGESFKIPYAEILVIPNFNKISETREEEFDIESPIEVKISSVEDVAEYYREKVNVALEDEDADIIQFTVEDPIKLKAQQILDQMILRYNEEAIEDKNLVSRNTANFIEERLKIITQELDSVETGKEEFKRENQLTDIQAESQLFIENVSDFRNRQLEVETQLELANTMIEYLNTDEGLLPSNLGFEEEGVVSVIESYNQLVLERDRILAGSTERNPVVINLNHKIAQIRANVLQSLQNLRTSLRIARDDFNAQEAKIEQQIASVPSKEKQFRNIERQQNIKEALYLFLLQKREETSLSLAVTAPKAKIVDPAYSINKKVSPKTPIILLAAIVLGLLMPFIVLFLKNLLNNKIRNRSDIENEIGDLPIVGEIPKVNKNQKELIEVNDRSVLAEAFRILHTNLQYLLLNTNKKSGGNIIFVTSTIKGEGKTFVAFNLAVTLANSEKKVLIVGADLRNPQLQRYESNSKVHLGVSDYLVNSDLPLEELIQTSKLNTNLDIFNSGSIPPNPSELWRQGNAENLFERLREIYDYIIVDTAPALLVTDTFLINQYADLTLYITRAGYTEKKLLDFAIDAKNQGKLHDVGFVLNDVDFNNFGYGNKYGYSYVEDKDGFWEKIKSNL